MNNHHIYGMTNHPDNDASYTQSINRLKLDDLIADPSHIFLFSDMFLEESAFSAIEDRILEQVALFYGLIFRFGKESHIKWLKQIEQNQNNSAIAGAVPRADTSGIESGFLIKNTAEYEEQTDTYIINTTDDSTSNLLLNNSSKINYCIIFVDMKNTGHLIPESEIKVIHKNIQPFLIRIRNIKGELLHGVMIDDKNLHSDTKIIRFCNFSVKSKCIMNRKNIKSYTDVIDVFLILRLIMAQKAIQMCKKTIDTVRAHVSTGLIHTDVSAFKGIEFPHIKGLFDRFEYNYNYGLNLVKRCRTLLNRCLGSNIIPDEGLIEMIDCAKIFCTELARNTIYEIQSNMGSVCIMSENQPRIDICPYIACVVKEGDSSILRYHVARQCMRYFVEHRIKFLIQIFRGDRSFIEMLLILLLLVHIFIDTKIRRYTVNGSWIVNYENIMALSQIRIMHILRS